MADRLQPGDIAPGFTLVDDCGQSVTLSDLRGQNVIVYFYPAAMTPGCAKQACDFSDSLDRLQAEGYTVLGISPDKPDKLAKFRGCSTIGWWLTPDMVRRVRAAADELAYRPGGTAGNLRNPRRPCARDYQWNIVPSASRLTGSDAALYG